MSVENSIRVLLQSDVLAVPAPRGLPRGRPLAYFQASAQLAAQLVKNLKLDCTKSHVKHPMFMLIHSKSAEICSIARQYTEDCPAARSISGGEAKISYRKKQQTAKNQK